MKNEWKAIAQMPNGYAIEDSKGRVIAMTQCDENENDDNPITWQEEVEHSNLIASAPTLLEALEDLLYYSQFGTIEMKKQMENKAKAAINKAKGE